MPLPRILYITINAPRIVKLRSSNGPPNPDEIPRCLAESLDFLIAYKLLTNGTSVLFRAQ